MWPLQSASGMSLHRTSMLLEEVATTDTLLGPEEGTEGVIRVKVSGRSGWVGCLVPWGGQWYLTPGCVPPLGGSMALIRWR